MLSWTVLKELRFDFEKYAFLRNGEDTICDNYEKLVIPKSFVADSEGVFYISLAAIDGGFAAYSLNEFSYIKSEGQITLTQVGEEKSKNNIITETSELK